MMARNGRAAADVGQPSHVHYNPAIFTTATWLGRVRNPIRTLLTLSCWLAALWLLGEPLGCALGRPTPCPRRRACPQPLPAVIEVLTTPEGATVALNGTPHGTSPQRVTVPQALTR